MEKMMRSWWMLAVPAALILVLLTQLGLPTLFPALRAPWFRLLLIAVVALGLGGTALWRWRRGKRASATLADGIGTPNAVDAEEAVLGERLRHAIAQLKSQAGGKRDYLYRRPWYVIIGPPGAGKTTALANSGLRFPWGDTAVRGVGGTRNLDFWFADEAVLVDTAGRYTTQDSDSAADAAGWDRFLHMLHRARPLEPINGVIVALGVDQLLDTDRAQLDAHIDAVRRRLAELQRAWKIAVPVYLLLPKADLLAGFAEYFDDLSAEGRRAVLGATLDPVEVSDMPTLIGAFDRVVDALWVRSPKRLQEEPDQHRRGLILGFPAQVASLRQRLAYFVEGAFRGERDAAPMLRGFYLTSGTQGGTPFDRVLSEVAQVYDAPKPAARAGRAYFLNRLLSEVVIPEAGLVRPTMTLRRRRRAALVGTMVGIGLVALLLAGLWTNAFVRNKALQTALLAGAQAASEEQRRAGIDLAAVRGEDPELERALPLLNQLRALPRGFADQARGAPQWSMRLGLFQSGHGATARLIYLETVQRVLLPRILLRGEQAMREQQQQPDQLYAPLKAYLMLGGYGQLDRRAVRAWVTDDWRRTSIAGADRADIRAQLARHLDAMLADPDLGRVWPDRRAPLDAGLIASTRVALQSLSLADRAYAVLRQRAAALGHPDWKADAVLASGDRQAFRNGDAVLGATIPWFFTSEGYRRAYRPGLRDVRAELDRDLWVLGPDAAKRSTRDQLAALRGAVAERYGRDYSAAWDAMLGQLQPADYFRNAAALGAITRTPSPLKILLLETARNTALGDAGGGAAGQIDAGQIDAGQAIAAHFRSVADFAGKDASVDAPVDALLKALRQAATATAAGRVPGAALGGGVIQGQLATALGELSTAGVVAPPQMKTFVEQATRSGTSAAKRTAQTSLQQDYAANVLPACLQSSRDRYPFDAAATQDASPVDLQRVYGANGQLDVFVRDRLRPLLQTDRAVWRWNPDDPVAAGFAADSAAQFQKASAIRDLLAGGLALTVGMESLGADATAVVFSTGGTSYRFDAADRAAKPLLWNLAVLPSAQTVVFAGTREASRAEARGAFAIFHLLDRATIATAGPARIRARFGSGTHSATLVFDLPSDTDPFGRASPFSFHCPKRL